MDYFTRTYVSGQPYSIQRSFMRARPQTNVKLITTNRSQVNYTSTPQGTLRKPYQHDTYDEMPYLFSGYPAVRRNWFDSKVGGQGKGEPKIIKFRALPFNNEYNKFEAVWADAHDSATGTAEGFKRNPGNASVLTTGAGTYSIDRYFVGFDLRGISASMINQAYFQLTFAKYEFGGTSRICIQQSDFNPHTLIQNDASTYSNFLGGVFATVSFMPGKRVFKLNKHGLNYVRQRAGKTISFCIREYDHDFLNIAPAGASETYYNHFHTAIYQVKDLRPTLIINY